MDLWMCVIGIAFCFFLLRGIVLGFSGEIASLLGLVAAVGVIAFGYEPIYHGAMLMLADSAGDSAAYYCALSVVVVGVAIFIAIAYLARGLFSFILPQPFDAILGGLVGAAKGFFLISTTASVVWMVRDRAERFQNASAGGNPIVASTSDFWADRFQVSVKVNPEVTVTTKESSDGGH